MNIAGNRWALLVATQHGNPAAAGMSAEVRQREMRQLLARAKSVATPLRTVVLIADRFEADWRELARELPPLNLLVEPASTSVLAATEQALLGIQAREGDCPVILIPADHCAAIETSWVISAGEALRLAASHQDTVYLLHDKPREPLPFDPVSDLCSSTVVVGSVASLLELCRGTRPTHLIELTAIAQSAADGTASRSGIGRRPPIRIVRIQSVEEYARLQRGDYSRPPALIDVRA